MKNTETARVAVIGAGTMGTDIALEFARFGYSVALCDLKKEILDRAVQSAEEELALMVEAELISDDVAKAATSRLSTTTDVAVAVNGAGHVVEAVPEDLPLKQQVLSTLDELCEAQVSVATNTSGLRLDDCIVKAGNHPERILSTHYWWPAHLMPLVEVIGGSYTDLAVMQRVANMLRGMRKKVIIQEHELPTIPSGWGNALYWAIGPQTRKLIDDGGCSPETIDDLIRFGFGRRLAYTAHYIHSDVIGLDFQYRMAKSRGQEPWGPIAERVDRGELGMKTGKGFYDWSGEKPKQFLRDLHLELIRLLKRDLERGEI